jgi:cellulose synthase/poly-beta-1,6-N-acetylglucosamine synthase-like glycosyltransferase
VGHLNFFIILFLLYGIFFIFLSTACFPLVATFLYRIKKGEIKNREIKNSNVVLRNVSILIPAHNEEQGIAGTLESILSSVKVAKSVFKDTTFSVCVATDNCTDNTLTIVKGFEVEVLELKTRHGKWKTLKELVQKAEEADWIVFADVGVRWQEDLLSNLLKTAVAEPDLVGIFPTYCKTYAGIAEKISWKLERSLKNLENYAGGPVSSHGATVAYRKDVLKEAFRLLSDQDWLNDDVVLPMAVRCQNPQFRLKYCANLIVYDDTRQPPLKREFARRLRLVRGNVEWLRFFLRYVCAEGGNSVVLSLMMRRVIRLFWGYGILVALLILFLLFCEWGIPPMYLVIITVVSTILALQLRPLKGVFEAFIASLLVPYFLVSKEKGSW